MSFTTRPTQFYVQTPLKMAAGPTGPMAASSNCTHSNAPRRAHGCAKTGVQMEGRKAGCCVCSFKGFFSSIPPRVTFERRSMRRAIYSRPGGILSGRKIWARAPFSYESTYGCGLLAVLLRIMVRTTRSVTARLKPQVTAEKRSFTMLYH